MSRPVNADADATRQRMLSEAVALFSEHGLGSTSLRDVASAAGVSLAMVHHVFGSKDDLYEACIDATYAELAGMKAELAFELLTQAPLEALFTRAVRTVYRFAREHRTAVRLLTRAAVSSGELHPRGRKLLMEALDGVTTAVAARLGREPGDLRLPLQSMVFLVARYAAQDDGEAAAVVGLPLRDKKRAAAAIEDHLVRVALDLFGISSPRVSP